MVGFKSRPRLLLKTAGSLPVWLALAPVLALGLVCTPLQAERADRDKPTNIEADRLQYDDVKKTTVFTGNVLLTKGTIVIRGDRMILRQFDDGAQSAAATGKRASFRQKREGIAQFVNGLANEIEYDSRTEVLKLTGDALIRRLECDVAIDEITGGVIVYNARSELFTVDGKEPGGGNGRVRIVIQPRSDGKNGNAKGPSTKPGIDCSPGAAVPLRPAAQFDGQPGAATPPPR